MRVVDAGCGSGRYLVYLLQRGCDVFAADADARAVDAVRALAARLAPPGQDHADHFRVEPVESMTFPSDFADMAISSAVLHFARDAAHFDAMLQGTWRVLAPGGLMFCRLASSIGLVGGIRLSGPAKAGRPVLQELQLQEPNLLRGVRLQPDLANGRAVTSCLMAASGTFVDEATLLGKTAELGAVLLDPIKTTVVQNQRCMTTWVVQKGKSKK